MTLSSLCEAANLLSNVMEANTDRKPLNKLWMRIFSYRWIVRNFRFFLFLSLLAIIYIFNGHYSVKTVRSITKVSKELKDLEFEYKSLKSEVLFQSKQSEVARAVAPLGLKELNQPPQVIEQTEEPK